MKFTPYTISFQTHRINLFQIVQVLLEHGVEIYDPSIPLEGSPVYTACYYGQIHVLEYILEKCPQLLAVMSGSNAEPLGKFTCLTVLYGPKDLHLFHIGPRVYPRGSYVITHVRPLAR